MKKIITIILLTFIVSISFAQQYTPMTAAGYQMKRLKVDSTLHIPSFCGVPTTRNSTAKEGAVAMDTCNNLLYKWTNASGWSSISIDTTSLSSRINTKLAIVDTVNKWVQDVTKLNDSTIRVRKNNTNTDIILPKGTGGGGTSPNLQQVLDSGNIAADKSITLGNSFDTATIYTRLNLPTTTSGDNKILDMNLGDPNAGGYSRISLGVEYANNGIKPYIEGLVQPNSGYPFKLTGDSLTFGNSLTSGNYLKLSNENSVKLSLPESTSEHFLATSVNGNYADANGNVTISTGGVAVDTIFRTIGKDSIFYIKNGNTYAIKDSVGTNPAPLGYFGAWQDLVTQTAAADNVGYTMIFRTQDVVPNGISIVNNGSSLPTQITFANSGIYNIQFSSEFQSNSTAIETITIWLRKNGVDVAGSAGVLTTAVKKSGNVYTAIASWNYLLDIVGGEYYELVWSTTNHTDVTMQYYAAGSPPPAAASVILSVTQQSGIMAGTGITAINSLTGAVQTMVTGTDSSDFKIASTGTSHTFNLPTASATKRGALSSTDWSTFNGKIGASDTSVFQRKSISSYSIMANNTNAAANTTALPFHSATDAAYTGTVSFTGTTAPSGTATLRYTWSQVGNLVTFRFDFLYSTASGGLNSIFWDFPSDMPQPTFNASFTTQPIPYICNGGTALNVGIATTNRVSTIARNVGNTAWIFQQTFSGLSLRYFNMYGFYFTN